MACQEYQFTDFKPATVAMIDRMNSIILEYQRQGFVLTVRQLYYQLVARDIIPNTLNDYKRTASIINDAKLAGMVDWDALEDRTREFVQRNRWEDGAQILRAAMNGFHVDMWQRQGMRPFVIVEKEALVGVLEGVCREYDIPLLAARGYPSGSVLRAFAVDSIIPAFDEGQHVVVLHLGDHDPSGIDMTRDLRERLSLFAEDEVEVLRIALNMDQIEEQRPPENPAKTTDSRFDSYKLRFGESSWELDALSPSYLAGLIREHVTPMIDKDEWAKAEAYIDGTKAKIEEAASHFEG